MKNNSSKRLDKSGLARLCARSPQTISRYCRLPGWRFGPGPWRREQVPEILGWLAEQIRRREDASPLPGQPANSEIARLEDHRLSQQVRRIGLQANRLEMMNERERDKLLTREEVDVGWRAILENVRGSFADLALKIIPLAMRQGMPHTGAAAFRVEAEALIVEVLAKLAAVPGGGD